MEGQLNALDATFLELEEADESAHMHIGGVMIFEPWDDGGAPPLELVRTELEARTAEFPRYRQRLSSTRTGGLHWPRWEGDERFDIARHVVTAGLPEPRGEAELLAWAGEYFSQRLDRRRPLWEMVLIDLADGRLHHVAGTGKSGYSGDGGDARKAQLAGPKGVALSESGIFLADTESHTIRVIDRRTNVIRTLVGTGEPGDGPDGPPLRCRLDRPHGVEVDATGTVYIGDSGSHRVRVLRAASP